MQILKARLAFSLLLFLALAGVAVEAAAQSSLCTFTFSINRCVGCRGFWGPSWYVDGPTGGCYPCGGYCLSFSPAKATAEGEAAQQVVNTQDPNAVSRELYVSTALLKEIAASNPWAANALIGLQRLGAEAKIQDGVTIMGLLPTVESVHRLLDGDDTMAKSLKMPDDIAGRVSYRLERSVGSQARLFLSSYTVDEDSRMLFKVYPDVIVMLAESAPTPERGSSLRKKNEGKGAEPRTLTALSWKVME